MERFDIPSRFGEAKAKANELVEMLLNTRTIHRTAISNLTEECTRLRKEATLASEETEMRMKGIRDRLDVKSKLVQALELQLKSSQERERSLEMKILEKTKEDARNKERILDFERQMNEKGRLLKECEENLDKAHRDLHKEKKNNREIDVRFEELYSENRYSKHKVASIERLRIEYEKRIEELNREWKTMLKEQLTRAENKQAHLRRTFEGCRIAILKTCEQKTSKMQEMVDRFEIEKIDLEHRIITLSAEIESLREELTKQISLNGGYKTSIEQLTSEKNVSVKKLEKIEIKLNQELRSRNSKVCWPCSQNINQIRRLLDIGFLESKGSYGIRQYEASNSTLDLPSLELPVSSPTNSMKRPLEGSSLGRSVKFQKTKVVKSRGRPKTKGLIADLKKERNSDKLSIKLEDEVFQQSKRKVKKELVQEEKGRSLSFVSSESSGSTD